MKRRVATIAMVLALVAPMVMAMTVQGVELSETMTAGDTELILNGAGVRTKFFKLYVAALYLEDKSTDENAIIASDAPMAVHQQITSGAITAEKMEGAIRDGFNAATGGDTEAIAAEIEAFLAIFKDEIAVGDTFDFIYLPGVGVQALKNGEVRDTIEGLEFKKALFGIWLGDSPAEGRLKTAMLGK